jgi:N-formylglutamate amidohydrolase
MEARVQKIDVEISHEILAPGEQTLPLVLSSPHSGDRYSTAFLAESRLDPLMLRRSEDSFVDELFASAPRIGAPLLRALFPRAYVDANREPYELDPSMFEDALPDYANTRSPRVAAGLGTIPRIVANGADIYRRKLAFADALSRLRAHYWPYHEALSALVETTKMQFGYCLLIDCHSMPSIRKNGSKNHVPRVDIVLGDFHGSTCADVVVDTAARTLKALGYRVARNRPYAGGHVTRHYGRPAKGIHALQIEINRGLYMDEWQILRGSSMDRVARDMQHLITALAMIDQSFLTD